MSRRRRQGAAAGRSARRLWAVAGILATVCAQTAMAIGNFNPSPAELRLLPAYCGPRAQPWGNDANRPEVRRWLQVFGGDYIHMHHYCEALLRLHKARTEADPDRRRGMYQVALNNLEYVRERVGSGFVLRAELHVLLAETHAGLGDLGAALAEARRSVQAKPDYVRGIALLADLSVRAGQAAEARRALEAGLARKPQARRLRLRLACLDGRAARGCPRGYPAPGEGRR
ncbi:hypothetical protein EDC57_2300 [Inmirania thermothiophila]|uniref:Uncharacterized protein n=2 Tax=Inmirania thermothiophila TaxID=1750597 RepID=A0A3N1XSL0_9GAMM|nr:hypothetical protein EDC57_2300 [Inmirania thermothiophila]